MIKIKRILLILFLLSAVLGCQKKINENQPESKPTKHYKWKLVTAWPKNFPGLGLAPGALQIL